MTAMTTARRNVALFALALGGFAIGVTEFASMGVLPEIAADLLPDFAEHPAQEISRAGILISLYALGVVVGAPFIAAFAAKASQTTLVFWLLAVFIAGSLASAFAPGFETLAVARFLSGLPHAAFFGVVALIAGRLMGPGNQGKGIAIAMSGLPIANIFGVPLATWAGQTIGWRWAYGIVAVLFAVTLLLVLRFVPRLPGDPTRNVRNSLASFSTSRVWIMVAVASVGFAGFFALYSYIAEVVTRVTQLSAEMVPWVLATIGVGMTLGMFAGGWASDRNNSRTMLVSFGLMAASLGLYVAIASNPVGLFVSVFLVAFWCAVMNPAVQSRFIHVARDAKLMGAAASHAAFNIGNAAGAWLGGIVIAAGLGYLAPGWVGVLLAVVGGLFATVSVALDRRERPSSAEAPPSS